MGPGRPGGLGEGAQAMADLAELDALAEQLAQSYAGARAEDVDLDALTRQLGHRAWVDARRLAELERELERQGFFERGPDGTLRLSLKALRRLGSQALADVVETLRGRRGERDVRRAGAVGEPTGASRVWEFGDSEPWDASRTVRNAVLRRAGKSDSSDPGPLLAVSDVEVVETEQRSRATRCSPRRTLSWTGPVRSAAPQPRGRPSRCSTRPPLPGSPRASPCSPTPTPRSTS